MTKRSYTDIEQQSGLALETPQTFCSWQLGRRHFVQQAVLTALWLSPVRTLYAQHPQKVSEGQEMKITRNGSQPSKSGPAEWFTGKTRIDPLFNAPAPARVSGASVTFEPGARTAWHTHPLGQTLIVTAGLGRVQIAGGPIEEIHPGDIVWFPPGVKHWHGASPMTSMTHISIVELVDGKSSDWLEHVTDDQYEGRA